MGPSTWPLSGSPVAEKPVGVATAGVLSTFQMEVDDAAGVEYGVAEATWRDAAAQEPRFAISETPRLVGRAAALAADPDRARWNGQSLSSGQLGSVHKFNDLDGSRPDCWRYIREVQDVGLAVDTTGYPWVDYGSALVLWSCPFSFGYDNYRREERVIYWSKSPAKISESSTSPTRSGSPSAQ